MATAAGGHPMILRADRKTLAFTTIDSGITNMKQIGTLTRSDQRAEGTDIPTIHILAITTAQRSGMQPGIERGDDLVAGRTHGPSRWRTVIISHETGHRGLGGFGRDLTAADTVGNRHGQAGRCVFGLIRPTGRYRVLIRMAAPGLCGRADSDTQDIAVTAFERRHSRPKVRLGWVRTWVV